MSLLLDKVLEGTFKDYLDMPEVENINVNRAGEVFAEFTGGIRKRYDDKRITINNVQKFATLLATDNGITFNRDSSTLSTKLKDGTRVEIFLSSAVESGVSVSLRKRYPYRFGLKDFGFSKKEIKWLEQAVIDKKTLLVSGGTSTGKTTVLENLCAFIPEERRLITIQDPQEIEFKIPNILELTITETNYDNRKRQLEDISATSMRQNPDSVIIGEIRESILANAFRQLSNTGHPGSMASIHANSPNMAVIRVANLIHERSGGVKETIIDELRDTIDFVIQVKRIGKGKRVAEIEEIS